MAYVSSRFKTHTGKYWTRQLFYEENVNIVSGRTAREPLFTLHQDRDGLINFGKAYIQSRDPTGYKVTQELLDGDYTLWCLLMNSRWFVDAKARWDREMDAMIRSEALEEIRTLMKNGLPAQRLAAAKYLEKREYRKTAQHEKGRPKREDIDRAAKELAANDRDLQEDFKRIQQAG